MTLHLDYGDLTPLLSLWHFIKHSIGMLLAMGLPPPRAMAPPPSRAMAAAAPARLVLATAATCGREGALPLATTATASMGSEELCPRPPRPRP
jgi:hypothetical protein